MVLTIFDIRVIAQSVSTTLLTLRPKNTSNGDLQCDDGLPSWVSLTGRSITLWLALWWTDWLTLLHSLDWPLYHTVQRCTGGFTTNHTWKQRKRRIQQMRRVVGICAEDGVPASGKNSSQPRDRSDHQSRLCLICLTRGSRVAAISPGPEVLQINRHQKCLCSFLDEERFWKRQLLKDEEISRSKWATQAARDEVCILGKKHPTFDDILIFYFLHVCLHYRRLNGARTIPHFLVYPFLTWLLQRTLVKFELDTGYQLRHHGDWLDVIRCTSYETMTFLWEMENKIQTNKI